MQHNFRELKIWQQAMAIARLSYEHAKFFPKEEIFVLTSQIKRAATSIPSNIAEGCGRGTDAQLIYFLDIALGSSCELETQILLAKEFGYCSELQAEEWISSINTFQRMARTFRNRLSVQEKENPTSKVQRPTSSSYDRA